MHANTGRRSEQSSLARRYPPDYTDELEYRQLARTAIFGDAVLAAEEQALRISIDALEGPDEP